MPAPARPPTPADLPTLSALGRYGYLTAEQIRRLHYGPGVITYVRARLKRLVDTGYVARLAQPHFDRTGSAPNVFRLTSRGQRLVADLGGHVIRLPDERPSSYLFFAHTLTLNDVLIGAELLACAVPTFTVHRLLHERELQRQPTRVTLQDGRQASVVPDALLVLHEAEPDGPGYTTSLVWEVDLGTRDQRSWRQKIEALVAYMEGPYEQALGTDSFTMAVITPVGEKRTRDLLAWTEQELVRLCREPHGALFCFAGLPPAETAPETLFLGPHWRQPFRGEAVPLVLRGEEDA